MRPFLALALALAFTSPAAWSASPDGAGQQQAADPSFARGTPVPAWAEPLAAAPETKRDDAYVMRLNDTQVLVGATPQVLAHQVIQVNDRGALASIGQYRISFIPAYQKLSLHRVTILRAGKTIDHTATVNVRLLDQEESLDNGIYGGARFAQLLLDDVRAGDSLEIVYSLSGANPVFGDRWTDNFSWDQPFPVEMRRLLVMYPQERHVKWQQLGDYRTGKITPSVERGGALVRLRFEARGIEPVDGEPSVPNDYLTLRRLQFTEYRDWNEVAAWAAGLFPKAPPGAELTALAGQFARIDGKEQQASAALRWVQDEIRYFSVSLGENSHRPQPPDVVLKRRFGDCKDKSYLLASLLGELGIKAEPVLVNSSAPEMPGKVLATPGWFDHAIVRVELDGKAYYVDPTRTGERARISVLPVAVPNAQGLVVNRATTGLTRLPDDDATYPLVEHVEKLAIADMKADATLEARQVFRGRYAEGARAGFAGASANELKKYALSSLEKTYPGIRLEGVPEIRDGADGTTLELVARFIVPSPVTLKDGYYTVDIDSHILDGTLGIPDKIVRAFPFSLPLGRYRGRYHMQIMWPDSVRFGSNTSGSTIDNPYFYSRHEYARLGRQLDFQYDYRIKSAVVPAAAMQALHEQAEKLNEDTVNSLRVHESALAAPHARGLSLRNLEAVSARAGAEHVAAFFADAGATVGAGDVGRLCDSVHAVDAAGGAAPGARKLVDTATQALGKAGVPGAQRCVGRLLFAHARYADALLAFESDPPEPVDETWRELAWSRLASGDRAGAVRDAEKRRAALEKDGRPDVTATMDAMALLQRSGQPVPPALVAFARSTDGGTWPRPILLMQAGLIDPAELLRQAEAYEGDARALALNDAWFYIGQHWLAKGEPAKAADAFGWYAQNGLPSTFEHKVALAELERLQFGDADYKAGLAAERAGKPDRAKAEARYAAAAKRGVAAAQYRLGVMRFDERAYAGALPWLEKAAANGSADALNLMATMYERGLGVPADAARATGLLQKATARHGHAEASARLGDRYRDGSGGLARDPALALGHYLAAAELGNARAQEAAAIAFSEGQGARRHYGLANFWAEQASAGGRVGATALLASLLANGRGARPDLPRAIDLWQDAANKGSVAAQVELGNAYEQGRGVGRDLAKAKYWYGRAASLGDTRARLRHGVLTMENEPSADEVAKVLKDFDQLAGEGNAEAAYRLGTFYQEGTGVDKDAAAALVHYKAAAARDNDDAQLRLAMIYHVGDGGIAPDGAEAMKWYRLAAARRNRIAINNMADMYEKGTGVKQDYATAIRMYRESAHMGGAVSLYSLGTLYEHGRGVRKDAYLAYAFYALAAHAGMDDAYAAVGRLARRLTREQLASATDFASRWKNEAPLPDEPAATAAAGGQERAK